MIFCQLNALIKSWNCGWNHHGSHLSLMVCCWSQPCNYSESVPCQNPSHRSTSNLRVRQPCVHHHPPPPLQSPSSYTPTQLHSLLLWVLSPWNLWDVNGGGLGQKGREEQGIEWQDGAETVLQRTELNRMGDGKKRTRRKRSKSRLSQRQKGEGSQIEGEVCVWLIRLCCSPGG